jgi:SAM-dependent methyltransferase
VSLKARIMENPLAYRLVQTPFTRKKLTPVLTHNDLRSVRRVLDVGCGPGTNTALFADVDYTGMDINPEYIRQGRQRFQRSFVVADVTKYRVSSAERYDFILVNSLLHHLPDDAVHDLLQHLSTLLTTDGNIHILELVLPEQPSLARKMAQWDRGEYARPLPQWQSLFRSAFRTVVVEPYSVRVAGLRALSMIYFKGSPLANGA